ncbi:MAG: alpha,alpha-trehalase TreA [Ferruginibacter sp.]|nr:alpha,alpha-trehalase TreA [Ferruginibacter sp.]
MIKIILIPLLVLIGIQISNAQQPAPPDKIFGQLFRDVQLQKIFPDGKTFVDCIPKRKVKDIMYDYGIKKGPGMDLKKFVTDNFELPAAPPQFNYIQQEKDVSIHIKNLWGVLRRDADEKPAAGSSLLPLPNPYIVPGGRFREVYYWDSYFTMLGLKESGETAMIENMIKNFAYLINTYGHIPNGNRSYYLSRSQPPYFSMMVELLAGIKGVSVYKTYLPAMEKEYAYWMDGADKIKTGTALKHLVKLDDGTLLNRYCDENTSPRPESYKEDYDVAEAVAQELAMRIRVTSPEALQKVLDNKKAAVNLNLRSGAESGWDFSSRWFADGKTIETIQTTDIIPVDLNCLLYALEINISKAKKLSDFKNSAALYLQKANKRKAAILKYCWNSKTKFFYDYSAVSKNQLNDITAAGLFPLFVKIATPAQAGGVENITKMHLLKDGGIVTTTQHTGQQWDAPNGWAPLQWTSVVGLKNYGKDETAKEIVKRWLSLNEKVYAATGKLMEKYNVEDITKEAGGGEYPSQDGFGWTNGVYLAFKNIYAGK